MNVGPEFENEVRQTFEFVARANEPAPDLVDRLVSAGRASTGQRHRVDAAILRRTWAPLAAVAAAVILTVGVVVVANSSVPAVHPPAHHSDVVTHGPLPSSSPSVVGTAQATTSPIPSTATPGPSSTAPAASGSSGPTSGPVSPPASPVVGPGHVCGGYPDMDGINQLLVMSAGSATCATVQAVFVAYVANVKSKANADFVGPLSVEGWTCQSGPSDHRYTVCVQGARAFSAGQFAPTAWRPFSPSRGDAGQFYLDSAQTIRYYTSHAGFGTSSCSMASTSQNSTVSATSLGISVTSSNVTSNGRIVSGTVVVKNVSSRTVTLHETFDMVGDQLLRNTTPASPTGSWDGPLLGERTVVLAAGQTYSAQHQLPAYNCAGHALAAGSYTAQFYFAASVYSGGSSSTVYVPAVNSPAVTLR